MSFILCESHTQIKIDFFDNPRNRCIRCCLHLSSSMHLLNPWNDVSIFLIIKKIDVPRFLIIQTIDALQCYDASIFSVIEKIDTSIDVCIGVHLCIYMENDVSIFSIIEKIDVTLKKNDFH